MSIKNGRISRIQDTNVKPSTDKSVDGIASVVVTVCNETSYDQLFRKLPQQSEFGKIALYLVEPGMVLENIHRTFNGENVDRLANASAEEKVLLKQLFEQCNECGPDAVCFNFECCSGYAAGLSSDSKLKDIHLDLVTFLVKEFGCMTMFSDFSLKALIKDWDQKRLGPIPFSNVGEFGGDLELTFDSSVLKQCPSAQLNTVGSLSDGHAKLHALSGTIAFTLNEYGHNLSLETIQTRTEEQHDDVLNRKYIEPYEVQVLTIASKLSNANFTKNKIEEVKKTNDAAICEINGISGLAGHVLLTFPPSQRSIERYKEDIAEKKAAKEKAIREKTIVNVNEEKETDQLLPVRGMILTSCGHWIELMKLDVNIGRLLETVKQEWGETADNYQQMMADSSAMNEQEQEEYAAENAVNYVQSRAPAKFNNKMMRKKKFGY